MDKLESKLLELKELLEKGMNNIGTGGAGSVKAGAVLPSISKLPKPGNVSTAGKVKIPGQASASKKNPLNVAEQTHNKDIKDIRMKEAQAEIAMKKGEEVSIAKNGQWSLDKTEGRTTAVPGVSEMGIETRRSDPKSQSYARVVSPEKHAETAKEIARANIKQTKSIHPKLPK